jgi:uncharacterized protein
MVNKNGNIVNGFEWRMMTMNNKTSGGIKRILCLIGLLVLALTAQGASFDCAKAGTKVEHLICDNPEISKLDDELDAQYKLALQDHTRAGATKFSQRQWLQERNRCSTAICLRDTYIGRIRHLQDASRVVVQSNTTTIPDQSQIVSGNTQEEASVSNLPKGKFVLVQAMYPYSVCERFKDNLNQFRNLDFDQCNTRLSGKFPEFSRPYTWKEIPFDMALAEKAIRSTVNLADLRDPEMIAEARKEQKKRWLTWKKDSEPLRASGKAHMWITKIDIDGDGKLDTLLRMVPGGRSRIDPKRLSLWSCDYNLGELYLVDSASKGMAASFNANASWSSDIIHYAEDNHFYLLSWEPYASSLNGWLNHSLPDVGGTGGVTIRNLYREQKDDTSYSTPANICLIDWVPNNMGTEPN